MTSAVVAQANEKLSKLSVQEENLGLDVEEVLDVAETLPPENDEGNIEYKLKLVDPSPERFDKLVSQLHYRVEEGSGEAIYEIGVEDDGNPKGLPLPLLEKSLSTLQLMAKQVGCAVTELRRTEGAEGFVVEALVRKLPEENLFAEIRVAIMGNVDSGKSTLLGVLTQGGLDNGRGSARSNVFRHPHEIESGRTSSVASEIVGFNAEGDVVNYGETRNPSWTEIVKNSTKVITFMDLAGHEKYFKTTIAGLTGHAPDFAVLVVGANAGLLRMSKEHMAVALALKLPIFVVITKVDMAPPNILEQTIKQVTKMLKAPGCRKIPIMIKTADDVLVTVRNFDSERVAPVFCVSNVTGDGLPFLRQFLNLLPTKSEWQEKSNNPAELTIDDLFTVPGVGTVAAGTVHQGTIRPGQQLVYGPTGNGQFIPVTVRSIHAKRLPVNEVRAGQSCSLALKKVKRANLRKGMVIVDPASNPRCTWEFDAEILVLLHASTIKVGYQAVIHSNGVNQTAVVTRLESDLCRSGDRTNATFKFLCRPEFVKPGARLIFREGRTKGIGRIQKLNFEAGPYQWVRSTGGYQPAN